MEGGDDRFPVSLHVPADRIAPPLRMEPGHTQPYGVRPEERAPGRQRKPGCHDPRVALRSSRICGPCSSACRSEQEAEPHRQGFMGTVSDGWSSVLTDRATIKLGSFGPCGLGRMPPQGSGPHDRPVTGVCRDAPRTSVTNATGSSPDRDSYDSKIVSIRERSAMVGMDIS